ncbi:hypothetical protein IVB41_31125 [Bradyrhizobium sp. 44]|uniref:hypothetical protein n=1 Tax=Bradyrhizobium sp. 44 TaxID=2782675 RepID=UPI001FF9FED3|nr:hypothetical protein [Bradyrhizobium sp. 44]MCK1288366.1 hypothetical protein [Bradyrhizobium sp. 44]
MHLLDDRIEQHEDRQEDEGPDRRLIGSSELAFGLLSVAEGGGATMFARFGVMRALNWHHAPEFNPRAKSLIGVIAS